MIRASIPCGISLFLLLLFLLFLLLHFFFLFTGCWLESSVRVFSFFREAFVLFSFKLRSSFAPRRVDFCCFAVVVFVVSCSFLLSFYWLLVGVFRVRVFSFFREVFVLFSFKLRSSFSPRRVASCPPTIQCLAFFISGGGITVRVEIRCEIDVVLTCVFLQKQSFFVFLAWDSISQPHGEGDFTIHYTIDMQLLGSLAPLFLFV
jgi:hypothetical protein